MRIATYNVENLFSPVRAMNGDNPAKRSARVGLKTATETCA